MGRISTSPRYGTDITGPDLLSLRQFGGGGGIIWENDKKLGICNLQTGDQILMKFDI